MILVSEYFGTVDINTNADYDGNGQSVLQDYQQGIDPNIISFYLSVSNQYVNSASVPVQINVTAGMPSYMAVLDRVQYRGQTVLM